MTTAPEKPTMGKRQQGEPVNQFEGPSAIEAASYLAARAKDEGRPGTQSSSYGNQSGTWLVLVAFTPQRVVELETMLPKLSGVKGDPVSAVLRQRIAELEFENAVLRGGGTPGES